MNGDKGQVIKASSNMPTDLTLFRKFMIGCEKRMGRLVIQEKGISIKMMIGVMDIVETDKRRKRVLAMRSGALVILYGGALGVGEVFLLEASEQVKRKDDGKHYPTLPHVVTPLMGRFKNETRERNFISIPLPIAMSSDLKISEWVERLVLVLVVQGCGREVGPALCNFYGFVMPRTIINGVLYEVLWKL